MGRPHRSLPPASPAPAHLPQALFGTLSLDVMVLTVLYSIAGLGIAIVNDFKSIEGERHCGGFWVVGWRW